MTKHFFTVAFLGLALTGAVVLAPSAKAAPQHDVAPAQPATESVQPVANDADPSVLDEGDGTGKEGDSCENQTDCAPGYACRKFVCTKA